MLAKVLSSAVLGIDAYVVEVEADITPMLPSFATVGLPDGAVKESKERVQSAIKNSDFLFPNKKVTINLAPADVRKEGSGFDLPIAVGILAATGQVLREDFDDYVLLGELSGRKAPDDELLVGPVIGRLLSTSQQVDPRRSRPRAPHPHQVNCKSQLQGELIGEAGPLGVHVAAGVEHQGVAVTQQDNRARRIGLHWD